MDLRQLRYFVAVAETRHMRRAAEQLHLSQPPLSRQIQLLESDLGVQLFDRTAHGMSVTPAGQELLRYAYNIQNLVKRASEDVRRAGTGQLGRLDVGVYGSSVFGVVTDLLTAFRQKHPDVELVLHHAQTPVQVPALRQGRVLLVFERLLPHDTDIQVELVAQEDLKIALSAGHPLAQQECINFSALKNECFIVGSSPAAAATAIQLCRAHGFEPRLTNPASDVVTATLLAATGMGVTLVPSSMTNVRYPGIVYRSFSSLVQATMDLHCFYMTSEKSPLLIAMLDTVRDFRESNDRWSQTPGRRSQT